MTNPFGPDRMTHGKPRDTAVAVLKPLRETTCNRPATYLELCPESPSLPRPKRPHGVRRPEEKHVLDACPRPDAERHGHPSQGVVQGAGGLAAQVIEQLAQLIVRAHERNSGTT